MRAAPAKRCDSTGHSPIRRDIDASDFHLTAIRLTELQCFNAQTRR